MKTRFVSRLRRARRSRGAHAAGLAVLALATAGIVLGHAPADAARAAPDPEPPPAIQSLVAGVSTLTLGPVTASASLTQALVRADGPTDLGVEIVLEAAEGSSDRPRPPVAMALVIDTSGSMSGGKIEQAKRSVQQTIERMRDTDYVAVITYDSDARVVVPLGPVGPRRPTIASDLLRIQAGGGTRIPGALQLGHRALTEAPAGFVRRMVLMSDGIDGSGIGADGARRMVRGIADAGTTVASLGIGLDYEEAFLTAVADAGRGAYAFLAQPSDLQAFLGNELDRASATVAEAVAVTLPLPAGVRFVRAHGLEATPRPGGVELRFGPMASGDRRQAIVELALAPVAQEDTLTFAPVLRLHDRSVAAHQDRSGQLAGLLVRGSADAAAIEASRNTEVFARVGAVRLETQQAAAIERWRAGDRVGAVSLAQRNAEALRELQGVHDSPALQAQVAEVEADAANFEQMEARTEEGRAFGLSRNARRRARVVTGVFQ